MSGALDYKNAREAALERFPDAAENAYRLDSIAALLGANAEWEGADFLDSINYEVNEARAAGVSPTGSSMPHDLSLWRKIADAYGIEHDGEDEE
jgi:hypothetical protein